MKDSKMVVRNIRGTFEYPYTQLGSKKIMYYTHPKRMPHQGHKEKLRRITQALCKQAKAEERNG